VPSWGQPEPRGRPEPTFPRPRRSHPAASGRPVPARPRHRGWSQGQDVPGAPSSPTSYAAWRPGPPAASALQTALLPLRFLSTDRPGIPGPLRQEARTGQAPHPGPALPCPAPGRRPPLRDVPRRNLLRSSARQVRPIRGESALLQPTVARTPLRRSRLPGADPASRPRGLRREHRNAVPGGLSVWLPPRFTP
jgi:hypothetical protein